MDLRQSTASQTIMIGPFLDNTNGDDEEPSFTIANTDIKIWKFGATSNVNKNSGGATFASVGMYYIVLDATDTSVLGALKVLVHFAGSLYVFENFNVVTAEYYDTKYGTDHFTVDLTAAALTAVQAEVDTALGNYAGPTRVEATSDKDEILAEVADQGQDGLLADHTITGSQGKKLGDVGTVGDVWISGTRTLTAGTKDTEIDAIKTVTDVIPNSGAMTSIAQETTLDTVDTVVDLIKVDTSRVDGLIEESTGDQFTTKALNQAPSGTGGDATEAKQDTIITNIGSLKDFDPDTDDVAVVIDVTNQVAADMIAISGDSVAADNLELGWNGTGIIGDNYPSTQQQVGNLSTAAGGLGRLISSFVKDNAEPETNDYESTQEGDGVYHIVEDDGGNTGFYYQALVGGNGVATSFRWKGYLQSNGDTITVSYWDWISSTYKTIIILSGSNSTTPVEEVFEVPTGATGTGVNRGVVRLRFSSATATAIATDYLACIFSVVAESVGYSNGQIWIDTNASNTNTEIYVDGVADNPVSTWAAFLTLSAAIGITDAHIINGSTIQLSDNSDNFSLFGDNWILDLNGQSVAGAYFQGAIVSGVCLATSEVHFEGCDVGIISVQSGHFDFCSFSGIVTHTLTGDYNYHNCYSKVPGIGGPTFTKTSGQVVTAQWRNWAGSITASSVQTNDIMTISGPELNAVVLNGVDATIKLSGGYESLADNRTGSPVLVNGAFKRSDVTDTLTDTNELQTNQGNWLTAVGFSVHSAADVWTVATRTLTSFGTLIADIWTNVTRTLTAGTKDTEIDAIKTITDAIPNSGTMTSIAQDSTVSKEATAAKDATVAKEATKFNPANDDVAVVTLVETTTTNTDMVGTDSAALASDLTTHDGKLDTVGGKVDDIETKVDLIPTTAMRGTDNAALASALVTHESNLAAVDGKVDVIQAVTDVIPDSGEMTSIAQEATVDNVETKIDLVQVDITLLRGMVAGSWAFIDDQWIFYNEAGDEIKRYDMTKEGAPDTSAPDARTIV
jgi:DNA-binding phage protein